MFSMDFFRKNMKPIMAALTLMAMITFVFDDAMRAGASYLIPMIFCFLFAGAGFVWGTRRGKQNEDMAVGAILGLALGLAIITFGQRGSESENNIGGFAPKDVGMMKSRRESANRIVVELYQKSHPIPKEVIERGEFSVRFFQFQMQQALQRLQFGFSRGDADQEAVFTHLLRQEAKRLGITVSDEAVTDFIKQITERKLSTQDFKEIRQSLQISETGLYDILREELEAQRAADLTFPRRPITPEQLWQDFRKVTVQHKIEAVTIPVEPFVAGVPDPSDSQLRKFFEEHKEKYPGFRGEPGFRQPPKVRLAYLEADFEKIEAEIEKTKNPTDEDVAKHYEDNKEFYIEKPKPKADPKSDDAADKNEDKDSTKDESKDKPADGDKKDDAKKDDSKDEKPAKPADEKPKSDAEDKKPDQDKKPNAEKKPDQEKKTDAEKKDSSGAAGDDKVTADKPDESKKPETKNADETKKETDSKPVENEAEKPSESKEKPADSKQADAKKEGDAKKSDDAKGDDPLKLPEEGENREKRPEPKYRPLEEVAGEIREQLVRDRALEEIQNRISAVLGEMRKLGAKTIGDKTAKGYLSPQQVADNMRDLGKKHGLNYAETGLVSAEELSNLGETGIGKAVDPQSGRGQSRLSVIDHVFMPGDESTHTPETAQDPGTSNHYAYWVVERSKSHVPEFTEPGVKEQVLKAWKQHEAVPKAEARAKALAKLATEQKSELKEVLAGQTVLGDTESQPLISVSPPEFSLFSLDGNVPQLNPLSFQQARPQLTQIAGVDKVDPDVMKAIDRIAVGSTDVVPNADRSGYLVIHVSRRKEISADEDDPQRQDFMERWTNGMAAQDLAAFAFTPLQQQWAETIERRYNVVWPVK